jgi:hypothetical protein
MFLNPQEFMEIPQKVVVLLGMSGVGKTSLARKLVGDGWFHYSIDYRIGSHYMKEYIDNYFKKEAMKLPALNALVTEQCFDFDARVNIDNLTALTSYLGKLGSSRRGGISFDEYQRRQRQHRSAEVNAVLDTACFVEKAHGIYGCTHVLCDMSGSFCEIVDPSNQNDPILTALAKQAVFLYIHSSEEHSEHLQEVFAQDPKPLYYHEKFLYKSWAEYIALKGEKAEDVDPDDFMKWSYAALLSWRTPKYEKIAENWGYTTDIESIRSVTTEEDFTNIVVKAIAASSRE